MASSAPCSTYRTAWLCCRSLTPRPPSLASGALCTFVKHLPRVQTSSGHDTLGSNPLFYFSAHLTLIPLVQRLTDSFDLCTKVASLIVFWGIAGIDRGRNRFGSQIQFAKKNCFPLNGQKSGFPPREKSTAIHTTNEGDLCEEVALVRKQYYKSTKYERISGKAGNGVKVTLTALLSPCQGRRNHGKAHDALQSRCPQDADVSHWSRL